MASIEDDADEPAEESLISAVLHFKIGQPQATAKEIHAALASKDPVSLADVKKAASKAMMHEETRTWRHDSSQWRGGGHRLGHGR